MYMYVNKYVQLAQQGIHVCMCACGVCVCVCVCVWILCILFDCKQVGNTNSNTVIDCKFSLSAFNESMIHFMG